MTDAGYLEYPITLSHPAFSPSRPMPVPGSEITDSQGKLIRQDYRGTPERLPPVTVHNEDEEDYYKAQGYERAGKIDPSAWVRAHSDAPSIDYMPQKYPMWKDGVLIKSAADDPDASEADLAPPARVAAVEAPIAPANEDQNLRAELDELNRQMALLLANAQAMAAENARLQAEKQAEPPKNKGGRPRKVA